MIAGVMGLNLLVVGGFWFAGQRSAESQLAILKEKNLPTKAREVNDYYVVPAGVADTTDLWVAALVDPFDGKPLRYRIGEKRVLIYSVGEDAFDDDGDVEREPTEPARRPRDLGFFVPK